MKRTVWTVLLLVVFSGGCATVPFQQTKLVLLDGRDAKDVVERFQERTPDNFQVLSSVVFEYSSRRFSAIGTLQLNEKKRTFVVAGINPMGVKLFEVSGKPGQITAQYILPAFTRYGDIATAVGNDIRRIYFDLVPDAGATLWRSRKKLVFRQSSGSGFLEYVFAGKAGDLIEKSYYENNEIVWRVSYFEYRDQDGVRWPQGVVFIQYDYGYRLTVRQKELHVERN